MKLHNSIFVVSKKKKFSSTVEQINWANFLQDLKDTCSFQHFRFPKPRNKTKPRDLFIFLCNSMPLSTKNPWHRFFCDTTMLFVTPKSIKTQRDTFGFSAWHCTRRNILGAEEDIAILLNFFTICLDLGIIGESLIHCQWSVSIFQRKKKFGRFLIQGFVSLIDYVSYPIRV